MAIDILTLDQPQISIPDSARTLEGFRDWMASDECPERGRFAFLENRMIFDMSPEHIDLHVNVKHEIAYILESLNRKLDLGIVYTDGALLSNDAAGISNEPDVTFVQWESLQSGRAQVMPRASSPTDFEELVGSPDLVCEVVSPSSVRKDTLVLRTQSLFRRRHSRILARRCAWRRDRLPDSRARRRRFRCSRASTGYDRVRSAARVISAHARARSHRNVEIYTRSCGTLLTENRMTRRIATPSLLIVACAMLSPTLSVSRCFAQTPDRPNILLIYLDDFGWKDAGFMGSDFYETPNLDQLASEGMIFTDAYSCAANCAPARACLLSGQYTPRHEIYNVGTRLRGNPKYSKLKHIPGTDTLRSDIDTWAKQIQQAGYKTATMGKWHLSNDPLKYGFDINIGGTHSGGPPNGYFPPHGRVPGLRDAPKGEYVTDRLSDEAVKFIESNKGRPWLLYLTHYAVHTPLQGKPDLLEKYNKKKRGALHNSAVMAAMIESVDQGVGRIVAKLKELGLSDKTAIIFTSDNGGYGPVTSMSPLKGYKGCYYEGGIREPFFVTWPGVVKPNSKSAEPITGVDLYPTLCAMAGAKLPQDQPLDGVNIVPLFKGDKLLAPRPPLPHTPLQHHSPRRLETARIL